MNGLIQFLLSVALQPTAKAVVAGLSPSLRQLQQFNLKTDDVVKVLEHVATLAGGKAPTYAAMGQMTADDVKDAVEAIFELLKSVLAQYGLTLTDAQIATALTAITARVRVKFPAAA